MPVDTEKFTTDRITVIIAVIDFCIITAIIVLGQISHQINPLFDIQQSLLTYTPFYTGWILTAPLLGSYHASTITSFRNTVLINAVAWILTVLIGGSLRATTYFPGQSPPLFLVVMTGVGILALLSWRLALTVFLH